MAGVRLYSHQLKALDKMHNGCVLCGGVGSGKSITALAYYFQQQGGRIDPEEWTLMPNIPQDLYIITTARKRDSLDWTKEMSRFGLSDDPKASAYSNKVVVDSWNTIKKYKEVRNAFFVFDEQRAVGSGTWARSFIKLAKRNSWIMLSATPGDTWSDYIPLFLANGFYRTKTEFTNEHCVYSRFTKYPHIDKYIGTKKLEYYRSQILVEMPFERSTTPYHQYVTCNFDRELYRRVTKQRFNPYTQEPILNASELCYTWRRIVNSDESRVREVLRVAEEKKKVIIFYNFDYELEELLKAPYKEDTWVAQYNGHAHNAIPDADRWVYLVQYTAGNEAWNCIETDTIIFYSMNYSYRIMEQASGRIDRLNTPFNSLYYYHLKSDSKIDLAIYLANKHKKVFNERGFVGAFKEEK